MDAGRVDALGGRSDNLLPPGSGDSLVTVGCDDTNQESLSQLATAGMRIQGPKGE